MNIVTVANRLPVRMGEDGWELSPGGLVTALQPVMAAHSGAWVGWDGGTRGIPVTLPDLSIRLLPIGLSASQVRQYYHGAANATLWPLLHDAIEKPRFERAWWRSYQGVNGIFAAAALTALRERPDALAWVHDYHLMLVPALIRERHPGHTRDRARSQRLAAARRAVRQPGPAVLPRVRQCLAVAVAARRDRKAAL